MPRILITLCLAAVVALAGCATNGADEEQPAESLYAEAQEAMDAGNYEDAVQTLETLQARYPFGRYAEQAQLDIIYAYYRFDEPDSAVAAAERFIRLNPRHPSVPYAHFMQGVAEMSRGRSFLTEAFDLDRASRNPEPLQRAFRAFRTVVTQYPDSDYAENARQRMLIIRDLQARHELHVARFYMDRGAFVAAANRAKRILSEYDETPAVEEALAIMAEAYGKLEIPALREDIRRVIGDNFPDHPLARREQQSASD
ncbi:outer membrane protein assembly factor BamD [Ectothiorhodospiraceae bacterium WFHF3C12]|nr:outer membrane protein assembly factor BamD [Ectothiorhodospiraceae bacterium WFHF3C12]